MIKKVKQYKKNYLKEVILKLNFETIELGILEEFFLKKLKKKFPVQKEKKTREIEIIGSHNDQTVKTGEKTTYIFEKRTGENLEKLVEIGQEYIAIKFYKYKNSVELFSETKEVVSTFLDDFKIKTVKRIGLRFVNEINLAEKDVTNWSKYLNKNLLGHINFGLEDTNEKIIRAMSQLIFKKNDGEITFNYGIWNKEFPGEITEKEFILDYDCYSKLPFLTSEEDILERIKTYHGYIETLFEGSISQEFQKLLNK